MPPPLIRELGDASASSDTLVMAFPPVVVIGRRREEETGGPDAAEVGSERPQAGAALPPARVPLRGGGGGRGSH